MIVREVPSSHTPDTLARQLQGEPGLVLLQSLPPGSKNNRFSLVAVRPFLTFRSSGSRCEVLDGSKRLWSAHFGNPWQVIESLVARYEILDHLDLPVPLGGCFGFWGYDLRRFVEPVLTAKLPRTPEVPDSHLGFYGSLVAFDHTLGKTLVICTGLLPDGSRSLNLARKQLGFWQAQLQRSPTHWNYAVDRRLSESAAILEPRSNMTREQFLSAVLRAQSYIRQGDIYQVNLSHRFAGPVQTGSWDFYNVLSAIAPAPFSAFLDCGDFQLASSSPELFLRMSGPAVTTRPIKGTRPRSPDCLRDAQLSVDLLASGKERAELIMITDLLRNDLGKICEFGSVVVPEVIRQEEYSHVRHLVSTIEGRLRPGTTHIRALASCFPGGSVTGAPKIRAMEIIEELETIARGPYTGALGFLGFNQESQLGIVIRTVLVCSKIAYYHTGAGIVADSDPEAEYEETLVKARAFLEAWDLRRADAQAGISRTTSRGRLSSRSPR